MTRLSLFNSPFLLGFDQFERTVDRISKLSSDSYPPYNIEQISNDVLRITIAVAGFEKKERFLLLRRMYLRKIFKICKS